VSEPKRALGSFALVLASGVVVLASLAVRPEVGASSPRPLSRPADDRVASPRASGHDRPDLAPASASSGPPPASPSATGSSADLEAAAEGCAIDDPGQGSYRVVDLSIADARLHVPARVPERFALLVHFHGGEPARRLLVASGAEPVLVTVDAGKGSQRYAALVTRAFQQKLLAAVEEKTGRSIGKLALSAWSAGYGAVREWLRVAPDSVNAVVLLDAAHASYGVDGRPAEADLSPFLAVAERASRGSPFLWLTHSSIAPPGYASTTEVADALLEKVGARRHYAGLTDVHGVELRTGADAGALHVRGTTGTDPAAHCAHLRMLPDVVTGELRTYLER